MQARASARRTFGAPRSLYRLALRLYARLFFRGPQPIRIENVQHMAIVVLPGVFNGVMLRTGAFLASTLSSDLVPRGARVLDLGTGSGINGLFAARLGASVIATDINPLAIRCAHVNALIHHLERQIETRIGDLFEPVQGEKFDLILFNPPYYRGRPRDLPDYAWRSPDAFDRFLRELPLYLREGGRALIVLSTDGDIQEALEATTGLDVRTIRQRDFINETLTVYEIVCSEERV